MHQVGHLLKLYKKMHFYHFLCDCSKKLKIVLMYATNTIKIQNTRRYMTKLFYCNIQSICTHASATLETLMLRRSNRCFNMAMWHLMASVGLAKSVSDVDGDMRPPATPSFKCRLLLSGLLTRQAFLMSTSVVFTQPG